MFARSFIALLLVLSAPVVLAHGTGLSFESDIDGYRVDIGYNTEEFQTGKSVLFDFGISTNKQYEIEYTDVWVRLIKEGKTVYASGVYNSDFGGARMTYTFGEVGDYELSVRYQNGTEKLVSASFPLMVVSSSVNKNEAEPNNNILLIVFGIVGLSAGFGISSFIKKK